MKSVNNRINDWRNRFTTVAGSAFAAIANHGRRYFQFAGIHPVAAGGVERVEVLAAEA